MKFKKREKSEDEIRKENLEKTEMSKIREYLYLGLNI
jgi:hypothetical protein